MISPRFATLLCFVQSDALVSAQTCDLLLGVLRHAVLRAGQRRWPAVHQRHRDLAVQRGVGRPGRARDRGRAALRRGVGRAAAPARAAGRARRRGRPPSGPGARARRRSGHGGCCRPCSRELLAGQDGAVRGDPNWGGSSRRSAPRCPARRRSPSTSRSRACGVPNGGSVPHDVAALAERSAATRSSTRSACRRRRRDRALLLRPRHEYITINADYTT